MVHLAWERVPGIEKDRVPGMGSRRLGRRQCGREAAGGRTGFGHYIEVNQNAIPNYGDRYRHGETISTSFVESAVNQVISKRMVKLQQMRWTKRGAHLLLQVRTRVLNDDLRNTFRNWYPGLALDNEEQFAA
jgi:hypothetical protein